MPVLPLVGSMSTVLPGWIFPARSASTIMLIPMRSLTLAFGLKPSSLASTVALLPTDTLFKRTNGVFPTSSVISFAIFIFMSFSPEVSGREEALTRRSVFVPALLAGRYFHRRPALISRTLKLKRPAIRRSQAVEESLVQQFLTIARFLAQPATCACGLYNRRMDNNTAASCGYRGALLAIGEHFASCARTGKMKTSVSGGSNPGSLQIPVCATFNPVFQAGSARLTAGARAAKARGRISKKRFTSDSVLNRPRVTRSDPWARWESHP